MRQIQRDGDERPGPTSAEIARFKELEREVRELRQANEILRKASAYFAQAPSRGLKTNRCPLPRCPAIAASSEERGQHMRSVCERGAAEARPPISQMIAFSEESRKALGVEPICRALQFAPSTYYDRRAILFDPDRASPRARSDAALSLKIDTAWTDNRKLYGVRKVWHVLRRGGEDVAPLSADLLCKSPAGQRLHCGTVDAQFGSQRRGSRQKGHHHEPRHVSALPRR
jgi:hypothetical protein